MNEDGRRKVSCDHLQHPEIWLVLGVISWRFGEVNEWDCCLNTLNSDELIDREKILFRCCGNCFVRKMFYWSYYLWILISNQDHFPRETSPDSRPTHESPPGFSASPTTSSTPAPCSWCWPPPPWHTWTPAPCDSSTWPRCWRCRPAASWTSWCCPPHWSPRSWGSPLATRQDTSCDQLSVSASSQVQTPQLCPESATNQRWVLFVSTNQRFLFIVSTNQEWVMSITWKCRHKHTFFWTLRVSSMTPT